MKNLDKIIGYSKQVERLELVYDILESPERYRKFDTELPKNLLLYGAAGVGKTFMAEVLMEGCGRTPFCITETNCTPKKIKHIFRLAQKKAPSVIFIDDLDCYTQNFYEVLGKEMENADGEEVFFIATYDGEKDKMNSELSSLSFDFKIEIPAAEFDDKCKIFQAFFHDKLMDESFELYDFCCFAQDCLREELEDVYRMASVKAAHEGAERIGIDHLVKAYLELQETPLACDFTERTAYHEAGHAAVSLLLGETPACIVLDDDGGYYCARVDFPKTSEEKEIRYLTGLGGKACEDVFFSSSGFGSYGDLEKVKNSLEHDLSDLAALGFEFFDATQCESYAYNDLLAKKVRDELDRYYQRVKKLIAENRSLVTAIAERLKEKHYLLHSEIVRIFDEYRKN